MDLARCEDFLRERGFSLQRFPGFLRLVKAHCEVHVCATPSAVALKIPVVKAALGEVFPERLLAYLRERNASPKGPGMFAVEGDCIWCQCEIPSREDAAADIARTAEDLVAQVERLGPKILNLK